MFVENLTRMSYNSYILGKNNCVNEMKKEKITQIRNKSKREKQIWNIIMVILVVSGLIFMVGYLISQVMIHRTNQSFEEYIDTVTMKDEKFHEEIETLNGYVNNMLLSNLNRGDACNVISIMYRLKNKQYESILYMCKAMRYYQKEDASAAMIHTTVNLSSTLISATSYDVAESILYEALDEELTKDEVDIYHLLIYTNLAESMSQSEKYDQAIEIIQIAESILEKDDIPEDEPCILSLKISKALALQGLGRTKKSKEVLERIKEESLKTSELDVVNYAIPFNEVKSYVNLSEGNLKEAQKYFEQYVAYCDKFSLTAMKLKYIDKFTNSAKKYGYQEISFIQKCDTSLLDLYRKELENTNNQSARILLDTYSTSIENVLIRSRQRVYRLKVYGGTAIFIMIFTISGIVAMGIRKKSQQDFLTGAYNRGKLRIVYRALLKRKQSFFVIMFDIDDFKMCNDVYGHRFGDQVLERIAQEVSENLPKECILFRYGGEEFIVIGDLKRDVEAIKLAEQIRKIVESLIWNNGVHITISVGVASNEETLEPIAKADEYLYESKKNGKNRVTSKFDCE